MSGGISAKARRRIERELVSNEAWRLRVGRFWICPYCGDAIEERRGRYAVGDGRELERVVHHLERCKPFRRFEGKPLSLAELHARRRRLEEIETVRERLRERPNWRLFDLDRRWYCPYCAQATAVVVPERERIGTETVRAIARHLRRCSAYDRGRGQEKPRSYLESMVAWYNRSHTMAKVLRRKIPQDAAWRLRDAEGRWVCPYCRSVCETIRFVTAEEMLQIAPLEIARHLLSQCEGFGRMLRAERGAAGAGRVSGSVSQEMARLGAAPTPDMVRLSGQLPAAVSGEWSPLEPQAATESEAAAAHPPRRAAEQQEPNGGKRRRSPANLASPANRSRKETTAAESSGPRAVVLPILEEDESSDMVAALTASGIEELVSEQFAQLRNSASTLEPVTDPQAERSRLADVPRLEVRLFERHASHVAGDFVDVVVLEGERAGIVLGSSVGEGAQAQLFSSVARNLVRMYLKRMGGLHEALVRVNDDLCAEADAGSFVALTCLLLDPASGRLRYARAGTSAPRIYRPGARPDLIALEANGMALGVERSALFAEVLEVGETRLRRNDLLVVHSLGALTACDIEGRAFGSERFERLIRRYGRHEADYFIAKFAGAFEDWTRGAALREDASVLALKLA